MLSEKAYKILKFMAQVVLPAVTTFYGVLGATLNIPYTQEVITIAVAFDTMLGTILGISSKRYYDSLEGDEEDEDMS